VQLTELAESKSIFSCCLSSFLGQGIVLSFYRLIFSAFTSRPARLNAKAPAISFPNTHKMVDAVRHRDGLGNFGTQIRMHLYARVTICDCFPL
jgi:hypothetical protein